MVQTLQGKTIRRMQINDLRDRFETAESNYLLKGMGNFEDSQ